MKNQHHGYDPRYLAHNCNVCQRLIHKKYPLCTRCAKKRARKEKP